MSEGGMKEVCEFIYNQNDVLHDGTFAYCKFTTYVWIENKNKDSKMRLGNRNFVVLDLSFSNV